VVHALHGPEPCRGRQGAARIGLATSGDLVHWEKHRGNPVLEADPRWYKTLDSGAWHDQAWRDPWVFRGEDGDFHALVTARAPSGPADGRGVIGHARSSNLVDWETLPPLTRPGEFGELEVPQLVRANGVCYLLFSTLASRWSAPRVRRSRTPPVGGTFAFVAEHELGPFELVDDPVVADVAGSLYAGSSWRTTKARGGSSHSRTRLPTARSWEHCPTPSG
jgi:beta-fructofuranosidase